MTASSHRFFQGLKWESGLDPHESSLWGCGAAAASAWENSVSSLRDSNQCGKRSAEIGKVSRPPLVRAWVQVAQAVLQHTR